mmetsp:Transcript_18388/g.42938  ORF Transcript_18388/g.42938 Transcript_18388/m.42938 type:complete len:85 (+) Transcript_18388:122-376(+)
MHELLPIYVNVNHYNGGDPHHTKDLTSPKVTIGSTATALAFLDCEVGECLFFGGSDLVRPLANGAIQVESNQSAAGSSSPPVAG